LSAFVRAFLRSLGVSQVPAAGLSFATVGFPRCGSLCITKLRGYFIVAIGNISAVLWIVAPRAVSDICAIELIEVVGIDVDPIPPPVNASPKLLRRSQWRL
jgi:hypothetical protein